MSYQTLSDCVTQVMKSLGLVPPNSIVGSADATANQMVALATEVGQQLTTEHDWQMLDREMTLVTVIGQTEYTLPLDFDRFYSDASWNHTTRLPAVGSLTQQEWQMLKARQLAGTTFTMLYIVTDGKIVLYDTPSSVQTIVLPYRSNGWVRKADASYSNEVLANDDIILFDSLLFRTALRIAWMNAKQFDTSALTPGYERMLQSAKGKDKPARTLSLAGTAKYPYLGVINIPDTGYGAAS